MYVILNSRLKSRHKNNSTYDIVLNTGKKTNLLLIAPGPLSKGRATLCAWPPKFILNHPSIM